MTVNNKIATAVSIALLSVAGSATAEVTLYDYTEATSAFEDAYLTGSFNANDGNGFGQASYAATLGLDYSRVFSSADRNISVDADALGTIARGSDRGANSESAYRVGVSGQVDNYFRPNSKGAFWFASGSLGAQKDQEDFASDIGVGLGYGRVVNATPMAKALRLVQALRGQGSLKSVPSKAAHQQVASIINNEQAYKVKHGFDLYEQYWVADIEKALGQGSLGAGAVIKAYDVLTNEFVSTRRIGWKVEAGVGVVLSRFDGEDGGDPSLRFGAEYHRPLNLKTQFSNEAELLTVLDSDTAYGFENKMTLTYELTDKIDWENTWTLTQEDSGISGTSDTTNNYLSSVFNYELDNQLDLGLSATLTKLDDADDIDTSINFNVGYRLR
jgi:hypothetical protein